MALGLGGCVATGSGDPVGATSATSLPNQASTGEVLATGPTGPAFTVFDGSYEGTPQLVSNDGPGCPGERRGVVEVGDGALHFAYQPTVFFVTPVSSDGTIHGTVGDAVLDGRITGDELAMTVTTPHCHSQYALHFVWNHS
jgi:hypothetical protein